MNLTEELIKFVATEVNGTTITHFNGNEIDLSKWTKLSMQEAILRWCPEARTEMFTDITILRDIVVNNSNAEWAAAQSAELSASGSGSLYKRRGDALNAIYRDWTAGAPLGKLIASVFEFYAEPHLIQPTIIYDFPLAVSPLSKIKPEEPEWVERFEFYIGGFEVGNAFSELNDPVDQDNRFQQQIEQKERGDEEAMSAVDDDYVRALGYGLPPTAGEGIGIDRLTMLLTNSSSIRDVILFPLMRPRQKNAEQVAQKEDQPHGESAE
jgi:lysyl-tRNA synthetase class 2